MTRCAVYYFSGTGNSLRTADILKEKLPGAERRNIAAEYAAGRFEADAEAVVFVFPAYAYEMPGMARRFIQRARIRCGYAAALVTYGSDPGGALAECRRLLRRKNIRLDYAAKIPAVENFIAIFGPPKEAHKTKRLAMQEAAAEKAALAILRRDRSLVWPFRPFSMMISALFRASRPLLAQSYAVTDACTGCGLCARVCPSGAVAFEPGGNGKPVFRRGCEVCQSCLNYCPNAAINFFRLKTGAARYRHPAIAIDRMLRRE